MSKSKNIPAGWLTHFEKSNYQSSPAYDEAMSYFKRFEDTGKLKIIPFGKTAQGRDLNLIVVSGSKEFNPEDAKKSGKAIVLIQNGIHPGEIEGKDASMILLREILITKEKAHLLKNLVLLIIPVFNVDGHERLSPFNRPNQHGPKKMGWRVTANNLNLNRDYMKADSPEMQSWLKMFNSRLPDFMIDNHTTNGADYQYHVTYGIEKHRNINSSLSSWTIKKYLPHLIKKVEADGFLTAPYVEFKNGDLESGIIDWAAQPRLSTGYCAVQNRICLLVETHSLKLFENRVFSTLSMMTHTLSFINKNYNELVDLNKKADKDSIKKYLGSENPLPVSFKGSSKHERFIFKGFKSYKEYSEITGAPVKKYSGKKIDIEIPFYNKVAVDKEVTVPFAYIIPKEFNDVIERIKMHGIEIRQLEKKKKLKVERYRFKDVKFWPRPYEGRQLVDFELRKHVEEVEIQEGSCIIYTKQRRLRVIVNLLEPEAPDSFIRWGFFNAFFERKEYAEAYIMEPAAKQMLRDKNLRDEFYRRLEEDEDFRNSPGKRLDFFYRHSAFYDRRENMYPVFRLVEEI